MKLRFSIRHLLLFTLIVAVLVWGGLWFFRPERTVDPFPPLADIASIDARYYWADMKTFPVPKSEWKLILDAMRPARLDERLVTRVLLGDLQLTLKDGRRLMVTLLDGGPGQGAFAIEETPRKYFQGGDTAKLGAALARAELLGAAKSAPATKRNLPEAEPSTLPAND